MSEELDWLGDRDVNALVKRFDTMLKADLQYFFDVDEFEIIIDYYFEIHDFNMARTAIEQAFATNGEVVVANYDETNNNFSIQNLILING